MKSKVSQTKMPDYFTPIKKHSKLAEKFLHNLTKLKH